MDRKQIESSLETISTRSRFEYPTHFTVDDLAHFRRKKASAKHIVDNLRPLSGKFHCKSEYKKKFRAFVLSIDETIMKWRKKKLKLFEETPLSTELDDDYRQSEYAENFVQHAKVDRVMRVTPIDHLLVQPVESESHLSTENKDTFVTFKEARRALLIRQPTTLKLEGEFNDFTESKENYKRFVDVRPSLICRKTDELCFDDEHDWSTEKNEMFTEFKNVQRARLIRRHSNIEFLPQHGGVDAESSSEYKTCFQYPYHYERRNLVRSMENLRSQGEINFEAEYASNYVDFRVKYPDAVVSRIEKKPRGDSSSGHSTSGKLNSMDAKTNSSSEYRRSAQKPIVRKPGVEERSQSLKNDSSKRKTILKSDPSTIFSQEPSYCKKSEFGYDRGSRQARHNSFIVLNTTKQPRKRVNFAKNVEYA